MSTERDNQSKRESEIRSEISKLVEVNRVTLEMSLGQVAEVRRDRERVIEEQYAIPEERQQAKGLLKGYEHEEEMERRESELRNVPPGKLWLPVQHDTVLSGFLPIPPMKGKGGTSEIWICKSRFAERTLIVKLVTLQGETVNIRPALALRELQTIFNLHHPNIVNVFDAGYLRTEDGEFPYVAMEEVPGITLFEWGKNTPHSAKIAAIAVLAIADAIQFCHDSGIAHGDLKPDNILIDGLEPTKDTIKIIDFGFAGSVGDSPLGAADGYADPSPGSGQHLSMVYRDIFALGGILYFVHTGRHPQPCTGLSRSEWQAWLDAVDLNDADLTLICRKCLAYDRAERYATAKQLKEDLSAWLTDHPLPHARKGDYSWWETELLLLKRAGNGNHEADHMQIVSRAFLSASAIALLFGAGSVLQIAGGIEPGFAFWRANNVASLLAMILFGSLVWKFGVFPSSRKIFEPMLAFCMCCLVTMLMISPNFVSEPPPWNKIANESHYIFLLLTLLFITFGTTSQEWTRLRPVGWSMLLLTILLRPLFLSEIGVFAVPLAFSTAELILCLLFAFELRIGASMMEAKTSRLS